MSLPGHCLGATVTVVFLAALVVAEVRGIPWLRWIAKPMASFGFLVVALHAGWPAGALGSAMVVALLLCAVGDVLLIPDRREIFVAGIAAFLAGHLAFGAAFLIRGVELIFAAGALVLLVPLALLVWRWLRPHVPARMLLPVASYVVVITAMVALATGTLGHRPDRAGVGLALAAAAFFLSDLAVARHRFVRAHFTNRLWGLPLYYGAQLVFAHLVGSS